MEKNKLKKLLFHYDQLPQSNGFNHSGFSIILHGADVKLNHKQKNNIKWLAGLRIILRKKNSTIKISPKHEKDFNSTTLSNDTKIQ